MKTALCQFVICSFLVLAVLLNACNMPVVGSPMAVPASLTSESGTTLREGLTMVWVDGSNLFSLLCDGRWMWASLTPVTNNMFSLCVQAGDCSSSTGPQEAKDLVDPTKGNQPVKIIGPEKNLSQEQATAYCGWIGGRLPTDEESKDIAAKKDANGNSLFGPEYGVGPEYGYLHCMVDSPRPMASYCQSSPYYDPSQPIQDLNHPITPKGSFCQNGKSYVTLDMTLAEHYTLQTVTPQGEGEDCQVVQGNRIVCGGSSNSSTSVVAGLVCDNMTGILDSSMAGIMDSSWKLNSGGTPIPTNGVQFNDLGLRGDPFTANSFIINGVMVAKSLTSNGSVENGLSENGLSKNELVGNGIPYPVCPPVYYLMTRPILVTALASPSIKPVWMGTTSIKLISAVPCLCRTGTIRAVRLDRSLIRLQPHAIRGPRLSQPRVSCVPRHLI